MPKLQSKTIHVQAERRSQSALRGSAAESAGSASRLRLIRERALLRQVEPEVAVEPEDDRMLDERMELARQDRSNYAE